MNNLKFYRAKAGFTMASLAEATGVTRQAICCIEKPGHLHRPIPTKKVETFCELLNVNRFRLLGDEFFVLPPVNDAEREELIKTILDEMQDKEAKERIANYAKEN